MNDIQQLADANTAIDAIIAGGVEPSDLNISSLQREQPVASTVDIGQIASIQTTLTAVTGSTIDLGSVSKIADCFRNIDDLLIERVTQAALDQLTKNKTVKELASAAKGAMEIYNNVEKIYEQIECLKDLSLTEMLLLAKKAGYLDKLVWFKKITDTYGEYVTDLNSIIANIANLDICNLTNYKSGVATPTPGKITNTPIDNYPAYTPVLTKNDKAIEDKQKYDDAMFRVGDIVNDKDSLEDTPATRSMLASLQILTRTLHSELSGFTGSTSSGSSPFITFLAGVKEERRKNSGHWDSTTDEEFNYRAAQVADSMEADSGTIRNHYSSRRANVSFITGAPEVGVTGTIVLNGVGIYGDPSWDYRRFLNIGPSSRPADLLDYWVNTINKDIEADALKLREYGIKTGTQPYERIKKGAYLDALIEDKTCTTTMFPGGTILLLENPDGTIFDPTGNNPTGLITVKDANYDKRSFNAIDLYVSKEDSSTYLSAKLQDVIVKLVSVGDQTSHEYEQAITTYGG